MRAWICCRSASTSPSGSTRRTTGAEKDEIPAIDLDGKEFVYR
jgi:hypothetical protein